MPEQVAWLLLQFLPGFVAGFFEDWTVWPYFNGTIEIGKPPD
jgi:hypothetical protein